MDTEKTCACKGGNLGKFVQPIILNILKTRSCNGYQLIKLMEGYPTFEQTRPDPTGIYRYLKAMEEKGLIEQESEGDGVYRISGEGLVCLGNWRETLKVYSAQIGRLAAALEE